MKNSKRRGLIALLMFGALLWVLGCSTLPKADELTRVEKVKQAESFYLLEDWERAEKIYSQLTEREPVRAEEWFRLGNIYTQTDRPQQAIEAYSEALALSPQSGEIHFNQALAYLRLAVNSWNRSLRLGGMHHSEQIVELLQLLQEQYRVGDEVNQ